MPEIKKTEGIVIRCKDLTETSQLVWFYTKDFGKLKVVAKGSRARTKKFKSKLDLFSQNEIVFYINPKGELHTLTESEIIEPFTEIRTDIAKMAVASYIVELLDNSVAIEDPGKEIYSLVMSTFKWLKRTEEIDFLKLVFEIKLLQYSGTLPEPEGISKGASAIVRKVVQTGNFDSLRKLKVSRSQLRELKKVIGLIIDYSVGKRLKSLDFLEEVCRG